jgi:hypothetical protein
LAFLQNTRGVRWVSGVSVLVIDHVEQKPTDN